MKQAKDFTFAATNFVRIFKFYSAIVEAHFLKLFASNVKLGVKFSSRFIECHKLIQRANFELGLVNLHKNHRSLIIRLPLLYAIQLHRVCCLRMHGSA